MKLYHNINKNLEATGDDEHILFKAHTDIIFISIFYQDNVGGIHIRKKKGQWVNTKPFLGSFTFNIGLFTLSTGKRVQEIFL